MTDQEFPREYRIRKSAEYRVVFDEGQKRKSWPLLGFVRPNGLAHSRLGMAVSKKVGHAPRRNRIKRLFREAFRLQRADLPTGLDLVLIPLDRKGEYTLEHVGRALRRILEDADKERPCAGSRSV